jgi:hypothetical protein
MSTVMLTNKMELHILHLPVTTELSCYGWPSSSPGSAGFGSAVRNAAKTLGMQGEFERAALGNIDR